MLATGDAAAKVLAKELSGLVQNSARSLDSFKQSKFVALATRVLAVARAAADSPAGPLVLLAPDARAHAIELDRAGPASIQLSDTPADRDSQIVIRSSWLPVRSRTSKSSMRPSLPIVSIASA